MISRSTRVSARAAAVVAAVAGGLLLSTTACAPVSPTADPQVGAGSAHRGPAWRWAKLGTAAYPVPAGALFVSRHGSDTSTGTRAAPLRTIQAAINRAASGTTIVVRRGSYHESLTLQGKNGITIQPAARSEVWLDGSRRVRRWQPSGSNWVSTGWTAEFNASPTYTWNAPDSTRANWRSVSPEFPMAAHPDQVFVNGRPLRQVGSLSAVGRGRFFVDYATDRLYVGTDPTGKEVRASDLAKAMTIRAEGTLIRGIGVRRFAPSVPHMGAITVERPGNTLRNMVIRDNATTGLHLQSDRQVVRRVTLRRNGMLGLHATSVHGLRLSRLRIVHNNTERFNHAPVAGGAKIGRSRDVVVRDSRFRANEGTGLWFDVSSYDISVLNTKMSSNAGHGLSLEISGRADVVDNVFAANLGNGIKINDTDNVNVWNNTFVGNARPLNIVQDSRDLDANSQWRDRSLPLSWQNRNITVTNNVMSSAGPGSNCLLCVEDYSHRFTAAQLNISANGNVYQRPNAQSPAWFVVWSRGAGNPATFSTIGDFHSQTGQEQNHLSLTGPAATGRLYGATVRVRAATADVAQPLPAGLAAKIGRPEGTRHLGAWLR